MKTLNVRAKHVSTLGLLLLLTYCGPTKVMRAHDNDEKQSGSPPKAAGESKELVQVRNFDQIYKTMSLLTETHPSEVVSGQNTKIYQEFSKLKSQLPNERDAATLSSFNQIAATRLGFLFCNNYIDKNSELLALSKDNFIDHLIEKFIGEKADTFSKRKEVSEILGELLSDQGAAGYLPNASKNDQRKRYKIACSALLSSNYVVVLRSLQ